MHFGLFRAWTISIVLILAGTSLIAADAPILESAEEAQLYDESKWGAYPYTRYSSSTILAPRLLRREWNPDRCQEGGQYYFFAPHGYLVTRGGPTIFDVNGNMVWFANHLHTTTYNFGVQTYKGEQYLTWWYGNNVWRDHGKGNYYMVWRNSETVLCTTETRMLMSFTLFSTIRIIGSSQI